MNYEQLEQAVSEYNQRLPPAWEWDPVDLHQRIEEAAKKMNVQPSHLNLAIGYIPGTSGDPRDLIRDFLCLYKYLEMCNSQEEGE